MPTESSFRRPANRPIRAAAWGTAIAAGLAHAWATRFWLSPDALNYLDIASAYLRGDWHGAVNAYWSPAFTWILAAAMGLLKPAPRLESTALHLVNFAGLLVALRAFEYFFTAFLEAQKNSSWAGPRRAALPDFGYWLAGYAVFLSTSFFVLAEPSTTTPDVWVAAETYLIAGLILRLWLHRGGWGRFATLGFALGCAYLTKTFYFPAAFVFLPAAWMASGSTRKTLRQAAAAVAIFAALAAPWIAAISSAKGRVTIGEVGKLAMVVNYNPLQQAVFWQGENGSGTPEHPVRLVMNAPKIFEFAAPAGGTYPPGYDWSYWMEGAKLHFTARGALHVLRQSTGSFFKIALNQVEFAVVALTFFFCAPNKLRCLALLRRQAVLWIPPLVACAAYAAVLVEGRYVAPFLPLLWLVLLFCFLGEAGLSVRAAKALILAAVSVTGLRVAKFTETNAVAVWAGPRNTDSELAAALRQVGIREGQWIAILGFIGEVHWARQAGVKIVSEMPLGQESVFWTAPEETKNKVFGVLAGTGARVVITKDPPLNAVQEGWIALGETHFFAHALPSASVPGALSQGSYPNRVASAASLSCWSSLAIPLARHSTPRQDISP